MAGTVITVSPRVPVADLERMARSRVARDGEVQFAATTADVMQRRQLRRLFKRLADDPGLEAHVFDWPDRGVSYLTVSIPGQRAVGSWGNPKTG